MVGRPKGSKAPRHLSMETKAKLQARKEKGTLQGSGDKR